MNSNASPLATDPVALPPSWRIGARAAELETPCWLVDRPTMLRNLRRMADEAKAAGVRLRPHVKTHKIPAIARQQIAMGARGIAVAKASEAEVMAAAGIDDIVVVYQPASVHKRRRLIDLARSGVTIGCTIEDAGVADALAADARAADVRIDVYLELNIEDPSGRQGRTGVTLADAPALAAHVHALEGLRLRGILGYRGVGWLYGPEPRDYAAADLQATADEEARLLRDAAAAIRSTGVPVDEVVAGSTPTARLVLGAHGITEVQPGEYVFYGGTHVGPGVATLDDCAVSVAVTVATVPTPGRAVIDGGSKVFAGDIKPDMLPNLRMRGLGIVRDPATREPLPGVTLTALSEEHGALRYDPERITLHVGDRLDVVPVHVCTSVNLAHALVAVEDERVVEVWPVAARGHVW
jgi:D-serine deaminase-like pyridoxal phosphate-dependent protein